MIPTASGKRPEASGRLAVRVMRASVERSRAWLERARAGGNQADAEEHVEQTALHGEDLHRAQIKAAPAVTSTRPTTLT